MKRTAIAPGAYQGLTRTAGDAGIFTILAFDQRDSYRKMLPDPSDLRSAKELKELVVKAAGADASAVLLDDEYGLRAAVERNRASGLIMALEKSGYSGDSTYRRTELNPEWTVSHIKHFGADAVKLLIYYHPHAGDLTEQQESLCRQVAEWAAEHDLAYFLEPVLYSIDPNEAKESPAFAARRPELVVETAARLSSLGAHVLKLEFPIDNAHDNRLERWADACRDITAASTVPWALLSAGVDFRVFESQVEVACRNGASGFLGGRAIWKEAVKLTGDARETFLAVTIRERISRLRVVAEAYGSSWKDAYVVDGV